jgi:hypothetical protein
LLMVTPKGKKWIRARVTIDGSAEEILAAVQGIRRGGERKVNLSIEVSRRHYEVTDHIIPEIADGKIENALGKLKLLSQQVVVDGEMDRRLEHLIREFGQFTAR